MVAVRGQSPPVNRGIVMGWSELTEPVESPIFLHYACPKCGLTVTSVQDLDTYLVLGEVTVHDPARHTSELSQLALSETYGPTLPDAAPGPLHPVPSGPGPGAPGHVRGRP